MIKFLDFLCLLSIKRSRGYTKEKKTKTARKRNTKIVFVRENGGTNTASPKIVRKRHFRQTFSDCFGEKKMKTESMEKQSENLKFWGLTKIGGLREKKRAYAKRVTPKKRKRSNFVSPGAFVPYRRKNIFR